MISPARKLKEASFSLPKVARPSAPSASGSTLPEATGRGGKACDNDRPTIMAMTASSSKSATGPVAICAPFRNIVMAPQNERTSRRRWEMKTIVTPRRSRSAMMAPSQSTSRPESVDVGSSSRRMRGSRRIALAISIFCLTARSNPPTSSSSAISDMSSAAKCSLTSSRARRRRIVPNGPTGP